ncbi:NEW3 domain-containing protein [Sphingobacterium sp.]|uniref:COG1470 family protein n=1 Tax=Sphingobacterium sp. TaxID=341027 RepID=UPI0028A09189|nr:NEW3 domain-containing protein [Sphingobacterium sp.]
MKTIIYKTKNQKNQFIVAFFLFLAFCAGLMPTVAQKGILSANLINLEASAAEVFRYQLELRQGYQNPTTYELSAVLPDGWQANFTAQGSAVRAIQVNNKDPYPISVEIYPSHSVKAGTYPIRIIARAGADTLSVELQAVIKGNYKVSLSTPDSRLNETVVAGGTKTLKLLLKNEGSLDLKDIDLSSKVPSNWEAQIKPAKVEALVSGSTQEVTVSLKTPERTIVGDYMVTVEAKNTHVNDQKDIRITVKASLLSGWLGILAILIAVSLVYLLIKKYGRR